MRQLIWLTLIGLLALLAWQTHPASAALPTPSTTSETAVTQPIPPGSDQAAPMLAQDSDDELALDWSTIAVLLALAAPCLTTLVIIALGLYYRARRQRAEADDGE